MNAKVRLYRQALKRQAQVQRGISAVTTGLFLGLLDEDDRARIDQDYYDDAWETVEGVPARYGDEAMVRSGLFEWERKAVDAHFPPGAVVAVVGAGAGREVLALAEAGFDAHGYDPHTGLVARGRALLEAEGHVDRLHQSERDTLPRLPEGVGVVVVGWGVYTLIAGRRRRVELLAAARAELPPGAPVLLSFFPRPERSRYLTLVHRLASTVRRLRGAPAPEPGDSLMPNFVHYFARAEIEEELAAAGLELLDFGDRPYGFAVGHVRPGSG